MDALSLWWITLGTAGQVFACIAIPSTVILLIQLVLMLIGLGGGISDADGHGDTGDSHLDLQDADSGADAGVDIDTDTDGSVDAHDIGGDGHDGVFEHDGHEHAFDGGLRLFTVRGFVALFSILGWTGVACIHASVSPALSTLIAVAAGFVAMLVVALIMRATLNLQYDGTENIRNALGSSGSVYIRVPANRRGSGKVSVTYQGRLNEKDAVTDEDSDIMFGEEVVVIGISGSETLIVKRKK